MFSCPNKSLPEWQELVDKVGEGEAYIQFLRNDFNIEPQIERPKYFSPTSELGEAVKTFLDSVGVTIQFVTSIKDNNGNNLSVSAVASIAYRTVKVVEGKEKLDTLPEEASHFLIEILQQRNSPLFNSMMSEITTYELYKDVVNEYGDLYNYDVNKLKKEAVAKLITFKILDEFDEQGKLVRVSSWWNKVLDYLKNVFKNSKIADLWLGIAIHDPFSEAADIILTNRVNPEIDYFEDASKVFEDYYQVIQQDDLAAKIKSKDISLNPTTNKYEVVVDGKKKEIKRRVSDRVKEWAAKQGFKERTEFEKTIDDIKAKYGTKGHLDLNNIVSRVAAKQENTIAPAKVIQTTDSIYAVLEKYVNGLVATLPAGTQLLSETTIYDEKADEAGTIDLLAIEPDGKVHIFDWKFIDLSKKNKNIPWFKVKQWDIQLGRYKEILKNRYGVKEFGKVRVVPIDANYSKNDLTSISVGEADQLKNTAEHLSQVPISEELTGNPNLDKLLETLIQRKAKIENSRVTPSATDDEKSIFRERKFKQLDEIQKAITEIQLKQGFKEYINTGLSSIREVAATPLNNYTKDRILDLHNSLQFYGTKLMSYVGEEVATKDKELRESFAKLVADAQFYTERLKTELLRRELEESGNEKLNDAQRESGIWSRTMRTISQQTNPIIQRFWNLVSTAKDKTRRDVISLNEKVATAIEGIKKVQPSKTGAEIFDFMLKTSSNGSLEVVAKYNSDFYKKLNEQRSKLKSLIDSERAAALQWIRSNTTFDQEAYNELYKKKIAEFQNIYRFDLEKEKKIQKRTEDFINKFGNTSNGLANPKNYFVKIIEKEANFSNEYNTINNSPKLKAFYDLWMEQSKQFQNYIGRDLGGRFVWNVHNDLVDSIRENGIGAFKNMDSVLDHLKALPGESLGMINAENGKPEYKLPTYYTDIKRVKDENGNWKVDSKNQSRDLGKVLSLVGAMAYNHKYMGEIESSAKSLELLMAGQETIVTDSQGNEIQNKLTGQLSKIMGSASTLEQFQDYINYYIYGVRNKTKDITYTTKSGQTYSAIQGYKTLNKWFVGKALAFNPVSIMANIFGGEFNLGIYGSMGQFFNNKQVAKAHGQISVRDKKAYQIMAYFDLVNGNNYHRKAEKLSNAYLAEYLTYDAMFIGQEAGDKLIRNSVLLAMLQSHTYKNGKIGKISEGDVNLYDQINTEGENISFGEIPQEILDGFRNKALALGDNILGNNTRDDIRTAQLQLTTRALLTFRNWIPRMVDSRYGELRYNSDLGTYEQGRYRTFWTNVINKQWKPLLWDSIKMVATMPFGGQYGNVTIEKAKELYNEFMLKNPTATLTEQDYIDLHIANLRGNIMEIYMLGALLGTIAAATPDDDEEPLEQGSVRKWFVMQMDRNLSELAFFYSPPQFTKILKSPIPIVNTWLDLYGLGTAVVHGMENTVGVEVKNQKKGEFRRAAFKVVPGLSGFESILSFIQEDYDSTLSYRK